MGQYKPHLSCSRKTVADPPLNLRIMFVTLLLAAKSASRWIRSKIMDISDQKKDKRGIIMVFGLSARTNERNESLETHPPPLTEDIDHRRPPSHSSSPKHSVISTASSCPLGSNPFTDRLLYFRLGFPFSAAVRSISRFSLTVARTHAAYAGA
jgi:hypothetical protein